MQGHLPIDSPTVGPVISVPTLGLQKSRARNMSGLLFDDGSIASRESARGRILAFHHLLRRLHGLPAPLRNRLFLFDELETRQLGEEFVGEPTPPSASVIWSQAPLPAHRVLPWLLRLLDLLLQLDLQGIPAHRMLRPECIFVTEHDEVLLGDLGLSTLISPRRVVTLHQIPEVVAFVAPEILGLHAYSRGDLADVHSLGCLAARLLLPRESCDFLRARDPRDKYVLPPPDFASGCVSPATASVLTAMAAADPDRRPPLLTAHARLSQVWHADTRQRPRAATHRRQGLGSCTARVIHALLHSSQRVIQDLTAELSREFQRSASHDQDELRSLNCVLAQIILGKPALADRDMAAAAAMLGALLVDADSEGRPLFLCLCLVGLGLAHLRRMDPLAAMESLAQARGLMELHSVGGEQLAVVIVMAEVEAALGSGRTRELVLAREAASRPVVDARLRELMSVARDTLDIVCGGFDPASAAMHGDEPPATAAQDGLLGHAAVRYSLLRALARLPLGFGPGEVAQLDQKIIKRLFTLAREESALRILPQIERPSIVLMQVLGGARHRDPITSRTWGAASPLSSWRAHVIAGIRWERTRINGFAVQHYTRALGLLPIDAAVLHHLELESWLASMHSGVPLGMLGTQHLAPVAEWLSRSATPAGPVSSAIHDTQRFIAQHAAARPRLRKDSVLKSPDAEITSSPARVAGWVMQQLLDEFRGMVATLRLLKVGGQSQSGSAASPRQSEAAEFEAALHECGWFDDMTPLEASRLRKRLGEAFADGKDLLRRSLTLSVGTLPGAIPEGEEGLAAARSTLRRIAGLAAAAPPVSKLELCPKRWDELVQEVNAQITHTVRRIHIMPVPIDSGEVHVTFVSPAAFKAALQAGLLCLAFIADYTDLPDAVTVPDSVPEHRIAVERQLRSLERIRYNDQLVKCATDTLVCQVAVGRGLRAELRLSARPYRTYDEDDRQALETRLAELVSAFMRVQDWGSTALPVPTQSWTLHLMTHEAKRPLLWLQQELTRLRESHTLGGEDFKALQGLLYVCVAKLAFFCSEKVWDFGKFDLRERVESLLNAWEFALRTSGEGLLLDKRFDWKQIGALQLWVRGPAVELVLSELLENARKHSRGSGKIEVCLFVTRTPTRCRVTFVIRNPMKGMRRKDRSTPSPTDQFASTGRGLNLSHELARNQLEDGRVISDARDPAITGQRETQFTFTALLVEATHQAVNSPREV